MDIIGFDIGGTKCAAISAKVNDDNITFLDKAIFATSGSANTTINKLCCLSSEFVKKHNFKDIKIGISCGGPLDAQAGVILSPPNLPKWDNVEIVKKVTDLTGIADVKLKNDADACVLAEWKYGAGKGYKNVVFLTFGTGLGAGLILGGKLYSGTNNMAGEVGHIRLASKGPVGYYKKGSFEGFCSGGGIRQLAIIQAEKHIKVGKEISYLTTSIDDITAKDVVAAAEKGKKDAIAILKKSGRYFGKGLSVIVDILNPEIIIAGSIFTKAHMFMRDEMHYELKKEALSRSYKACKIAPAELGDKIGDYAAIITAIL